MNFNPQDNFRELEQSLQRCRNRYLDYAERCQDLRSALNNAEMALTNFRQRDEPGMQAIMGKLTALVTLGRDSLRQLEKSGR